MVPHFLNIILLFKMDLRPEDRTEDRGYTWRQNKITAKAIKHYCEHVFRHWRLQRLVDCRQNRRERIYIVEEQGNMPEAIKHYCEHVFQP
jgi:hypothetical protein